jgi:very-short-patch-repair endonuclease
MRADRTSGPDAASSRSIEEVVAGFAGGQHGVVTRRQLLGAGLTPRVVRGLVKARRIRPLHRGVYVAGPVVVPQAREMAAVLACGGGAVVSHRSAGGLWGLLRRPADGLPVDVTIDGPDRGRRPGIRAHRAARLEAEDVTTVDDIPATTPPRTLVDLAAVLPGRELEQALAQAERLQLTSREELLSRAASHPGRRGMRALRALLERESRPALARSEAEERLLGLIRSARLPVPEVNATVCGYEVDFLWKALGLAVEVDGFAFHSSQARFENDRRRDVELAAEGIHVLRVTWRQLVHDRDATLGLLARTLGRAEGRLGRAPGQTERR